MTTKLSRWITERALEGAEETAIFEGVCDHLCARGVPLRRVTIGIDTLHPLIGGKLFRWWRGTGAECIPLDREQSSASGPGWLQSPYYHLLTTGDSLYRFRYPPGGGPIPDPYPFPILEDLALHGITEYVACVHRLGDAAKIGELDCIFASWSADAPDGYRADDVAVIQAIGPFLASALASAAYRHIARTLVETYLGRDAGERVLRGAIARGVAERIRAVVWFSDLKGFTSMVDTIDPEFVLPLLDDYTDPLVAAVHARGGTVLKFIGDGLLAIFPVGEGAPDACVRALEAADDAFAALDGVCARRAAAGLPITGAYVALHVGEVFYGNVGAADRLDFTVIGPAVNEAARMSAMCRSLGQDVIVSQAFADEAPAARPRLVPLGSHTLRGVTRAQALYGVGPAAR